jgi:hypothetical protein
VTFRLLAIRRRPRLPERLTLVGEWTLRDPAAEARARELASYYGAYADCLGMGV